MGEYAASIGPIPLSGPIAYFYDKMRKDGASAFDAGNIIKGLTLFGLGATGLHAREEPVPAPLSPKQAQAAAAKAARQRAYNALPEAIKQKQAEYHLRQKQQRAAAALRAQ